MLKNCCRNSNPRDGAINPRDGEKHIGNSNVKRKLGVANRGETTLKNG